ncbi:MAG: hypothetical protein IT432_15035 [Phycisphaerales bacterium]|nr:hypothetical protein [Phycisphaerales bacterium]
MQNKPTPPTTPAIVPSPKPEPAKAGAVTVRVKDNPDTDPASARAIHGKTMAGVVYANALRQRIAGMFPIPLHASAMLYVDDLIERMAPRDPAEEMLVVQLVLTHVRTLHLTDLANRQERLESIRTVHEYADRASNTYRRLMLALAEYRRPPRTGDTFAVVKQTNIAGQQVIQNHENPTKNATNEQGSKSEPGDTRSTPAIPPALPADTGGISCPSFIRTAGEALDAIHRPTDTRRQGPIADERDDAR